MVGGHINHSAQICWTTHLQLIKLYCCTNYKISFSGAVNLEAHLLTHTGEKPWRITLVPSKLLRGTRTLKRHLCNTQCSAQPYRCTVCKYGPTKLLCTNAHPLRSAVGNLLMCFFFFQSTLSRSILIELILLSLFQPQQGLYKWGVVLVVMKTMEGCMAKAMDPEVLWHGKTHGISDHAEIHGKSHGYWHGKSHAPKNFNFQRWWPARQKHFT